MPSSDTSVRFRGCSPYSPEELAQFRMSLLERRTELSRTHQGLADSACRPPAQAAGALSSLPSQFGEMASETYEQELSIEFLAKLQGELQQIQDALERIEGRSFGICEDCGGAIPLVRLEALPTARFCVACQSRTET
jgi:RNA polymerase-binding transcription factor DksA